jgi:hypothetical protein
VERITLGREEIELTLAALPPFPKMTADWQRIPGGAVIFCHVLLRGRKLGPAYAEPWTIGEHLKRRRLKLGLTQRQAARALGSSLSTVYTWEKNRKEPEARHLPGILRFLGYDPRSG